MKYTNYTPFTSLPFSAIDQHEQEHCAVVMRGTFDIRPGKELTISQSQSSLVMADEYYGEINKSSVKQESDLAPFKPKCDVIVIGNAYAPEKKPARFFRAGISITNGAKTILIKELVITGPRFWKKRLLLPGWKLTYPELTMSVPLQYEYAHGGECRIEANEKAAKCVRKKYRLTPEQRQQYPGGIDSAPAANAACETNTVGRGYAEKWYLKAKRLRKIPAPQIEGMQDRIKKFRKQYAPQGFGAITKAWQPRRQFTGTYDDAWLKNHWPNLPRDFDFAFYNCAHPNMIVPYLGGDEKIELTNLTPTGSLSFRLPGHLPFLYVDYEDGRDEQIRVNLDTLIIEPDRMSATLVWRAFIPVEPKIAAIEARMILKEKKAECQDLVNKLEVSHGK